MALLGSLIFLLGGCIGETSKLDTGGVHYGTCDARLESLNNSLSRPAAINRSMLPTVNGVVCNEISGPVSTLVVPLLPEGAQVITVLPQDGRLDWVFHAVDGSIGVLKGGTGPVMEVKVELPELLLPIATRNLGSSWAAWFDDELHVVFQTTERLPTGHTTNGPTYHVWGDGNQSQVEALDSPFPPYVPELVGFAATSSQLYFAESRLVLTDAFGLTTESQTNLKMINSAGQFSGAMAFLGHLARDVNVLGEEVQLCSGRGSEIHHIVYDGQNQKILISKVSDLDSNGPNCRLTFTDKPWVLTFAYPSIGVNGDGSGGSGDDVPYIIHSFDNGSWSPIRLARTAFGNVEMGSSDLGPFFVDESRDGKTFVEAWMPQNGTWKRFWGQASGTGHVVAGQEVPTIYASRIQDGEWNYDGWALVKIHDPFPELV